MRPGIVSRDSEGRATCVPIYSRIITLLAEQNELQYAVPGGLIGVGTTVSFTASARGLLLSMVSSRRICLRLLDVALLLWGLSYCRE